MHIIFPLDQLQEWEAIKTGNAQFQSLRCIGLLGGPVKELANGSIDVTEDMQHFQDQHGAVHWQWNDRLIILTPEQVEALKNTKSDLLMQNIDTPEVVTRQEDLRS